MVLLILALGWGSPLPPKATATAGAAVVIVIVPTPTPIPCFGFIIKNIICNHHSNSDILDCLHHHPCPLTHPFSLLWFSLFCDQVTTVNCFPLISLFFWCRHVLSCVFLSCVICCCLLFAQPDSVFSCSLSLPLSALLLFLLPIRPLLSHICKNTKITLCHHPLSLPLFIRGENTHTHTQAAKTTLTFSSSSCIYISS